MHSRIQILSRAFKNKLPTMLGLVQADQPNSMAVCRSSTTANISKRFDITAYANTNFVDKREFTRRLQKEIRELTKPHQDFISYLDTFYNKKITNTMTMKLIDRYDSIPELVQLYEIIRNSNVNYTNEQIFKALIEMEESLCYEFSRTIQTLIDRKVELSNEDIVELFKNRDTINWCGLRRALHNYSCRNEAWSLIKPYLLIEQSCTMAAIISLMNGINFEHVKYLCASMDSQQLIDTAHILSFEFNGKDKKFIITSLVENPTFTTDIRRALQENNIPNENGYKVALILSEIKKQLKRVAEEKSASTSTCPRPQ